MGRAASRRRYLMCPPTYFDVVYSINPWMDPSKPVDPRLAFAQWQRIRNLYVELGHRVDLIPPVPGLPDMVFAANGATVLNGRALVARFLYGERSGESAAYLDWFGSQGYEVCQAAWNNEGQGDYLTVGGWLLAGSGFRTDRRSHAEAEEFFGCPVIGLTLVDDSYYHLDTALAVLDESTVMYYPGAFTRGSEQILRRLFPGAITATDEDASVFGLNAMCDGHHVVLPTGAVRLAAQLRERGFEPLTVDISELLRAGGGVKCCTLELLGPVPAQAAMRSPGSGRGKLLEPVARETVPLPRPVSGGLSIVLTSVASDSHTWNLVYLQLALEELGHRVLNLGACVPDELLVATCQRVQPDLVVVSSVNGHGFRDGMRLIARIRACQGLATTPVVIGGKLGIAGPRGCLSRDQLLSAGFNAVFEEGAGIAALGPVTERLTLSVST